MLKFLFSILLLKLGLAASTQNQLRIKVINSLTNEPLAGAFGMAKGMENGALSDSMGIIFFKRLPEQIPPINISYPGFLTKTIVINKPYTEDILVVILEQEEEEEVMIQSTRSTRSIADIPTRVEFISGEELDEKANMKPGDIRMVLNESTGITTQVTSAVSGNASIRIQGLDGRYTQILRDGFPLYGGFSGGLGLLQTPPLDLKQFEVIKGSSSTLYGGGAIAGLVNLISKTPGDENELRFHADVTSAGGINTSGFYSGRNEHTGMTVFFSRNSNAAYDPSSTGLTAIPKFERYTVNPKFFGYLNKGIELIAGVNATSEKRTGGSIRFIKGEATSGYAEQNNADRVSTQVSFKKKLQQDNELILKNSFGYFKRSLDQTSGYFFEGDQGASFTELTYSHHGAISEWITGVNIVTDHFNELVITSSVPERDYRQMTAGLFVQHNSKPGKRLQVETGLRGDWVKDYGWAILPRISILMKIAPGLSSRIGGGLGYKTPTIFTEESERLEYKDVLPVSPEENKLEKSYGANADLNFRTKIAGGRGSFSINHLFFYTRITDPLLLGQLPSMQFQLLNIPGHFDSKGMETNLKIGYDDFKLFLGYTFTKAYLHEGSMKFESFLTPRHRLNSVLLYEVEEKWKLGLEAYYFSRQQLSDGATGRSYWIMGYMAEKIWEKISVYINFENFTDSRQSRFDTFFTGNIESPQFRDIYAPLDGFVMNGGVKLRL